MKTVINFFKKIKSFFKKLGQKKKDKDEKILHQEVETDKK